MTLGIAQLGKRLLLAQLFGTLLSMVASSTCHFLLLLEGNAASESVYLLWKGLIIGGIVALVRALWVVRSHRFLMRTLALGSTAISPLELGKFATEAGRTTFGWLIATLLGLFGTIFLWRSDVLDSATTLGVTLFGIVVAATTALPLYVLTRRAVMRALEAAPAELARELIESSPLNPVLRWRIQRRLIAALVTPVAFVTVGSTLVVTAHVRKAEAERRSATALAMARAAFETVPGILSNAGLESATLAANHLGYKVRYSPESAQYRQNPTQDGYIELVTPLDEGSVHVQVSSPRFLGIGPIAWAIAAAAALLAARVGLYLGSTLTEDVETAIVRVRTLDTSLALQEIADALGPTRFAVMHELGLAIEALAGRFRLFAQAQERAIQLREAATRMRGLFFASVSHDLKTPLNAILGFAAVIRQTEELTFEQEESLAVIERSGRELLALIEMILDAARVEARQLKLLLEPVSVGDLMHDIIEKGRYLSGDNTIEVVGDIADGIGTLEVDRVRVASALGTFLGHAGRTVPGALIRMHIAPLGNERIGFAIEIPKARYPSEPAPTGAEASSLPGIPIPKFHRGLALGMGLARSVIELHGGTLAVQDRGPKGQRFVAVLPARRGISLPSASRLPESAGRIAFPKMTAKGS